jgi:predicted TIM-barrel fold metal-dependent hydrolase
MLIVDAQAHIWTAGTPSPHHTTGRPAPFTANDLLAEMNGAGVDAALLAPPGWDPGGNKPSLDAAHAMPNRFAVTGDIDWSAPPDPKRIRNWLNQPGMYGLRLSFNTPGKLPLLTGTDLDWLWTEAERADVPVMLLVPGAVSAVGKLAARFPGLRLCVDHLGIPRGAKDAAAFEHLPDLLALAKHATISVKAGALPVYSTVDAFPHPSLHPYFRRVYDAFGPGRIFWASDITRVSCSYREVVTFITEGVPWLSQADKTLIMGRAVCDWLGWTPRREGQPLAAVR